MRLPALILAVFAVGCSGSPTMPRQWSLPAPTSAPLPPPANHTELTQKISLLEPEFRSHVDLGSSAIAGIAAGLACGLVSAALIVVVRLPPFIATLGVMGIARGAAFIITEGRYFDVSGELPAGFRLLGVPLDWTSPLLMVALALVFQILMTRFQWGRAVFAIGGNETAALYSGVRVGAVQASVYIIAAVLAAMSGVALAIVQGQGKADLAMGYELDIIASAVVGGASLAGGRGSVVGAVLGALIFGVLRNALPQIPGATFYDRLIVGLVVIVIVVMDQILQRKKRTVL